MQACKYEHFFIYLLILNVLWLDVREYFFKVQQRRLEEQQRQAEAEKRWYEEENKKDRRRLLEPSKHMRYVKHKNGQGEWTRDLAQTRLIVAGILYPDGAIQLWPEEIRHRFWPGKHPDTPLSDADLPRERLRPSDDWLPPGKWHGRKEVQLPDGSWQMPDGAIIFPDGTLKDTPEAYVPEAPRQQAHP